MRKLLLLLLSISSLGLHAEVYTYIDEDGNRVFTDQPKRHAERIELAPSNSMGKPPSASTPSPSPAAAIQQMPIYQLLRILVPEPDATIHDASGNLIVTVTSEPGLQPGHSYRLLLDGKPVGTAGRSPVFPLENIDRGTHQLSVEILDSGGRILERTPSQPFHMQRISLAQKRKTNPCEKADYGVRPECPLKDKPPEPRDIPLIPFI
jgi:hypothetical protein